MISKDLASEIVIGLNIAYERNLPKDAVDTILLICSEYEAAQPRVQPTPPTEPQNFCNPVNGVHASWCTGHKSAGG